MSEASIQAQHSNGVGVLAIHGEHDIATAPQLREQIERVLAASPLVIDLSEATFVDSSILRVLLTAREDAQQRGLGFAVCLREDGNAGVRRILEVTGLVPMLPVHPSREAAVAEVSAPA